MIRQKKKNDFTRSICEICKFPYKMSFKYGLVFQPRNACKKGLNNLLTAIFSAVFTAGLVYLVYFFAISSEEKSSGNDNGSIKVGYKYGIIACAGVIGLLFFIVFILSLKEAFFVMKVVEWKIYNYDFKLPE